MCFSREVVISVDKWKPVFAGANKWLRNAFKPMARQRRGTRATSYPLIILDLPTLWCDVEMGAIAFVVMEGKEYAKLFLISVSSLANQISASARSRISALLVESQKRTMLHRPFG